MKKLWKKKTFRRYFSFILILCIGTCLYIPLSADEVQEEDTNVSMEGEPRLNYTDITEAGMVAGNDQLQELIEEYFSLREETMSGNLKESALARKVSALAGSKEVLQKEAARIEGLDNMAIYHGVHVQEWTNHIFIDNEEVIPATVSAGEESLKLSIYEWNWVVYNDGNGGPKDEMGFSTIHEMTLKKDTSGQYRIITDVYDESDFLGKKDKTYAEIVEENICDTITQEPVNINPANSIMSLPSGYTLPKGSSVGSNKKGSVSYNVQAVRKYADKYVGHSISGSHDRSYYNSNYVTFIAPDGSNDNDCANYVSQCLLAGGMHIDYGPNNTPDYKNKTNQWWYNPAKNNSGVKEQTCTATWRGTLSFESYWTGQGYSKVSATASNVFPGNPVYDSNHLTICVGYNAVNEPLLNGHTNDWYHVPFSYYRSVSAPLYTIQLVSQRPSSVPSNATAISPTTQKQSKTLILEQGQSIFLRIYNASNTGKKLCISSSAASGSTAVDVEALIYERNGSKIGSTTYYKHMIEIAYDDDSGGGVNFSIKGVLMNTGYYYIEIRGATSTARGNFVFNYWLE